MTEAYYFTCRPKPLESGRLQLEPLAEVIRTLLREKCEGLRTNASLPDAQPRVYVPSARASFFRDEAAVEDPTSNKLPSKLVFVTTGDSYMSGRLFSKNNLCIGPVLAPFVDAVRVADPWATVGFARLLMRGSSHPPPICYRKLDDLNELLASTIRVGEVLETQLDGTPAGP